MECNEIYSVSSVVQPKVVHQTLSSVPCASPLWTSKQVSGNINKAPDYRVKYQVYSVNGETPDKVVGEAHGDGDLYRERHRVTIQENSSSAVEESVEVVESKYSCTCRKDLIGIKVFYFSFIGALGCVLPYVAVFLKQMGLSPLQIGVISGIRPIIGFLSGPVWGTLGDRFNIRRSLLMISLTAWLSFYVGLYFIPQADRIDECPENLKPHRDHIPIRKQRDVSENTTQNNAATLDTDLKYSSTISPVLTSLVTIDDRASINNNLSDHDLEILRENLGWSYKPDSLHRVFITSLIVIVGGEFFQAPTTALSDTGTLQTLGPDNLDSYGAQRAWGAVGWAFCSLIGGSIVSAKRVPFTFCGIELVHSDYHIIVYVFIGFMAIAYASALNFKFKSAKGSEGKQLTGVTGPSPETKHSLLAVVKLFWNVHYGSWIMTAFFVGVCNGVIWGFLFWHLDNLGANQLLMGLDSVVACTAEFISFFLVGRVVKVIGHMGILYIGLWGYAVRFLVYAFLTNPWWVLPADILQGMTFSLIWASLTKYTAESVPEMSLATVQGILHGVYFGLGNGIGHLLGGILIGEYGAVVTFIGMAVACVVVFILFLIAQKCSKKPSNIFNYQDLDRSS